jgi:hypothetical protein
MTLFLCKPTISQIEVIKNLFYNEKGDDNETKNSRYGCKK